MASALYLLFLVPIVWSNIVIYKNVTQPVLPGMESMSSDKIPHFTIIETVSRSHSRTKRQVIAGPMYEWQSNIIPYQIWGGDGRF